MGCILYLCFQEFCLVVERRGKAGIVGTHGVFPNFDGPRIERAGLVVLSLRGNSSSGKRAGNIQYYIIPSIDSTLFERVGPSSSMHHATGVHLPSASFCCCLLLLLLLTSRAVHATRIIATRHNSSDPLLPVDGHKRSDHIILLSTSVFIFSQTCMCIRNASATAAAAK